MKILVTGSTSGIGQQLALDYLKAGHTVYCCGRKEEPLAELHKAYPEQARILCFDVADYSACKTHLQGLAELDIVILNAGTCEYVDAQKLDAALFKRVFDINVGGVVNCLEFLVPQMATNGNLALMGSSSSFLPLPRAEAYGAPKAAIAYLASTLSISLRAQQIHVSYIAPGFVDTPLTKRNDFPMPMQVSTEFAARKIRLGISNNKRVIHFPRLFTGFLKLLAALPMGIQSRLIARATLRRP